MIGQQKRPLEHTVSSQPVKYQKHFDDNLCEANTRVASLTDEQLEFQQHFSGVSQKTSFSVSPGSNCDALNVDGRPLLSETRDANIGKVLPGLENGVHLGSHEVSSPPKTHIVAKTADELCAKGSKIKDCEGIRHQSTSCKEFQGMTQLVELYLEKDRDDPPLSDPDVSIHKDRTTSNYLGSTTRDHLLLCSGDGDIGLHRGVFISTTAITADNQLECGSNSETVHKAGEAQSLNGSGSPPLIENETIDFAAMHEQVTSLGGYGTVTSAGLWGNVCESLGLEPDFGPGLKLIHFNYLKGLENDGGLLETKILGSVNTRVAVLSKGKSSADERVENCSLTVGEQSAERDPFHEKSENNSVNGGSSCCKIEDLQGFKVEAERGSVERVSILEKLQTQSTADVNGFKQMQGSSIFLGTCSFSHECQDVPGPDQLDSRFVKGQSGHVGTGVWKEDLLRKSVEQVVNYEATLERDCKALTNLLVWIKRMALEPGNPDMGQGPEGMGQTEDWVRECASRARKVRTLLWKRRHEIRPGDAHLHQVKQILAPSLYYDIPRPEQQSLERLRATRERVAHYGTPSAPKPLHESVGTSSSFSQTHWVGQANHRLPRQSHFYIEERYAEDTFPDRPRKRIPIGSDFQACIPLWRRADHPSSVAGRTRAGPTGDDTQSSDEDDEGNCRWLGKQVWPPSGCKRGANKDQIGQGRASFCSCLDPESLDCVRQHIVEERDRLKQELGQAFYTWKFDQMGESVADDWTNEEEQTFRTLVKMNPPSRDKNFWDQLPEALPGKKMKDLASYYFNVFVFRRRAIQNRLDPNHVDSDDDETNLSDGDSDDSENYESGEEVEDEADEDASDDDEEYKIDELDSLYEGEGSAKLSEDKVFCELRSAKLLHSSKISTGEEGVPETLCSKSLIGLEEDAQQAYHDPCLEERGVQLHSTCTTAQWKHDEHDNKHLEHISISGEELQEVKTWEAAHWDEANHDPARVMSHKVEPLTIPTDPNPSYDEGEINSTNQCVSLGHCEGQVWGPTMDFSPRKERDKLLSTHGMIQEFFGDESTGLNTSN